MSMNTVHNYYERLVFNEIKEYYADTLDDENTAADMACIALNRIAPRYIRHAIDMSFYMSVDEHHEVEKRVKKAVRKAYKRIQNPKAYAEWE
jgi:hypothetical protein